MLLEPPLLTHAIAHRDLLTAQNVVWWCLLSGCMHPSVAAAWENCMRGLSNLCQALTYKTSPFVLEAVGTMSVFSAESRVMGEQAAVHHT